MTDKPNIPPLNTEHITEDVDPARMRTEMEGFFEHVLTHDPKTLQFTAMLAGHEQDGGTHVCTMFSGPPHLIARAVAEAMETVTKIDPTFAVGFLMMALKNMKEVAGARVGMVGIGPNGPLTGDGLLNALRSATAQPDYDATGGDAAAKAVADIIATAAKFADDNTPPSDNETKH